MKKAILGKKIGMTQIFNEEGKLLPVTVVEAGPCVVIMKKTTENDGYDALQVGFVDAKDKEIKKKETAKKIVGKKRITFALQGHFNKNNVPFKKYIKEFRLEDCSTYEIGQEIKADIFAAGDKVDVSGISKGKGFAGVIKRWHAQRGPETHGSKYHRAVGSMGASSNPARTFKNKHLPGHMGAVNVTVLNLQVAKVIPDKNIILIKGAIPGPNKGIVVIKNTVKA